MSIRDEVFETAYAASSEWTDYYQNVNDIVDAILAKYPLGELERLREFAKQVAATGIPCDTTPTVSAIGQATPWWYDYLHRTDEAMRDQARRALGGTR